MSSDRPTFEVGFVLAGAISAGCYSAGVMDFIIEALDDYYRERDRPDWDGPRHDVRVPVLAGASAGGMTAGMAALHMFRGLTHVSSDKAPPPKVENRLYSSWVTDIAIERLLETTDLQGEVPGLASALCSDVLDEILANAFKIAGPVVRRPWVGRADDPTLRVMLTLTNLRGVPYSFSLRGSDPNDAFGMLNHADVGAFTLGDGIPPQGRSWLDVNRADDPSWGFFKAAALATGAFPLGLKPRSIVRDATDYLHDGTVGYVDPKTGLFNVISPDDRFPLARPFQFWAVDGGTIDNEPLELARRFMTGNDESKSAGTKVDKAVVLIAPFPNFKPYENDKTKGTLASVLPSLVTALTDQARFKAEELANARDATDFSRFIISPDRKNADGSLPKYAIASGALGGFSGFLDLTFRRHDYLLGRRNAQAFLRWNFALPQGHPIFEGKDFPAKWVVRDAGKNTDTVSPGADLDFEPKRFAPEKGARATLIGYPIIPLTDAMTKPIDIPAGDVPRPSRQILDALRPRIRKRVAQAVQVLVDVDFLEATNGLGLLAGVVRPVAKIYGTEVVNNKVTRLIGEALDDLAKSFP